MKNLSRRSLLKQIAGVSMLAAAAPLIGCCAREKSITLNVVLHGLFVLKFTDQGINLFTPDIKEHIYRAGNWDLNAVEDLTEPSYRLRGVGYGASAPTVDTTYGFSQKDYKFSLHPEFSRFVVYLPFPQRHAFVRCIGAGDPPNTPSGPPPKPPPATIEIYQLALCQVLSYAVADYRDLKLENSKSWKPQVDWTAATANLHFWAEPEKRLGPHHSHEAYRQLSRMVAPPHLRLMTNKTVPLDRDTGVYGLSSEEEQGWYEWESGGEGSFPTNCGAVALFNSITPLSSIKGQKP